MTWIKTASGWRRPVRVSAEMMCGREDFPPGVTTDMVIGCKVYLDGIEQEGVQIADEPCGLICRWQKGPDGNAIIESMEKVGTETVAKLATELVYGRVRIVFPGEDGP